jgi:hypothetical protein
MKIKACSNCADANVEGVKEPCNTCISTADDDGRWIRPLWKPKIRITSKQKIKNGGWE